MATPVPVEERVRAAAFEGLFERALHASGPFAQELTKLGVDLRRLQDSYPIATWHAAVALARQHAYSRLSEDEANFQLGRVFVRGFATTLVGSVIAAAVPLVGPNRFLKRMPRIINTSRIGRGMEITLETVSPRDVVLHCVDPLALPYFNAGIIHEALLMCRVEPAVSVDRRGGGGFDLRAKW